MRQHRLRHLVNRFRRESGFGQKRADQFRAQFGVTDRPFRGHLFGTGEVVQQSGQPHHFEIRLRTLRGKMFGIAQNPQRVVEVMTAGSPFQLLPDQCRNSGELLLESAGHESSRVPMLNSIPAWNTSRVNT